MIPQTTASKMHTCPRDFVTVKNFIFVLKQ